MKKKKKEEKKKEWYEKFRWFFTSSGKLVIGGKNAEQNEKIINEMLEDNDVVLHTKARGSPFCVIKVGRKKLKVKDIEEAAIFCAGFSKEWKKKVKEIEVHVFRPEQIVKEKNQAVGTFTVLGKVHKCYVKPELWLGIQKNKLRCAAKSCFKKPLIRIKPGNVEKEKAIEMIKEKLKELGLKFNEEEIAQAIPSRICL